ncbi:MAG: hypothetical protein Q9194_002223 [Teloschistes cf. exilis]
MGLSAKRPPVAAEIELAPLKNCLVNLPQSLVVTLTTANAPIQDIIVEVQVKSIPEPSRHVTTLQRSIYVGWSGMPSSTRRSDPLATTRHTHGFLGSKEQAASCIEIDDTFGRILGLTEGQLVGLLLHTDPPLAHTVNIEPLTSSDWDIIELHANFLELNLVSQIRALPNPSSATQSTGQGRNLHPLTLHLSPTSTANIIITSVVPPLAPSFPFARLAPDAEVIVSPKSRAPPGDGEGSRNIAATGRKSAGDTSGRSGTSRHGMMEERCAETTLLLRPCDRRFCREQFDDEHEEQRNTGLRVWIDSDIIMAPAWRRITHAAVSIVYPTKIQQSSDPQPEQTKASTDSSDTGKPASDVVAKLLSWYSPANPSQAALSSLLCSSLQSQGIVGGIIKLKPAPPLIARSTVPTLLVSPFSPRSERSAEFIQFGGEPGQLQSQPLHAFHRVFGNASSDYNLLDSPLTDGLYLPPAPSADSLQTWHGGIIRFGPIAGAKDGSAMSPIRWCHGSALRGSVKLRSQSATMLSPNSEPAAAEDDGKVSPSRPMVGVEKISTMLRNHLLHQTSVLLVGGLGSGKSTIATSLGQQLRSGSQVHLSFVSCRNLTADGIRTSVIRDTIEGLFQAASWATQLDGRSLIIIDDLDKLCSAETELQTQDNDRSRHISELICNTARSRCGRNAGLTLLATAQSKESMNSLLVGANIFKEIINLQAPDKDTRLKHLQSLTGSFDRHELIIEGTGRSGSHRSDDAAWMNDGLSMKTLESSSNAFIVDNQLDLLHIAGDTDGYMPADLALLVTRAKSEALIRSVGSGRDNVTMPDLTLNRQDFENALQGFVPATLRNVALQSSSTTFSSIGGLKATRKTLLETLQYPTLYAPIFAKCPLRLRSGILLYGYPGCGKTLLASAIAGECGLNFISVKGPEILNKYIGASEKGVRDLFERAESARPCVLFFDEFDSIAPKRGHDSTGVTDRVVNQLLTQMDGAEGLSGVYVLAATSRPDLIDPALLRPGRLDKSILCDLPGFEDRLDILKAISKKLHLNGSVRSSYRHGLSEVARRTDGYSGADLQALVYNAHLDAIHEQLKDERVTGQAGDQPGRPPLTSEKRMKSDILRFRFGTDIDGEGQAVNVERALEATEYAAIIRTLENTRRLRSHSKQDSTRQNSELESGVPKAAVTHEVMIQWHHLESSLASTRRSISAQERGRLESFYRDFVVGRNGELPDGQNSTEIGGRSSLM